jgi:O-antigen ligase
MWLFLIAFGSAVFGLSFGGSMNFIINFYFRILVFFVLLLLAIRNVQDLRFILWSYVISVGILVMLSLTVMDLEPTMGGLGRLAGTGMFDANDLGMIFLMGLPLAFFFNYNSGGLGRWISRAVIVGIPAGIALTGSRGAMVGLAVVGPVLFLVLSRVGMMKRLFAVGVIVGGLVVAAPAGYWEQMRTIFAAEEDYNVTEDYGRVELAKRGAGYMLKYPFFGVGIGNFPRAEGTISPIAVERMSAGESVQWIAPHNTYAQVGAELGLFAFGIWLSLLYAGTIGLWRLRRRLPESWNRQSSERKFLRELCLFLPLSFLAFAVTSFFLSHAFTPPFYILIGSMAAVHVLVERQLVLDRRTEQGVHRGRGRARRPVLHGR